ncbi:MAG: CinA family protein [Dehalococcoidia bacterium]|nr:CinA family protein [Dehalococcoidia bacterium]
MTDDVKGLVERIHNSPKMAVIAVSGAGAEALAWLLGVPGASRTVLEAVVPYSQRSMAEFLGHEPAGQYVSPDTAREMAESAYRKALRLRERGDAPGRVVGLSCTATIATDRPKRGEHRCCIATCDDGGVTTYSLKLAKGSRDRAGEEDVVSRIVLRALAEAFNIETTLPLGLLDTEQLDVQRTERSNPLQHLLASVDKGYGEGVRTVTVYPDGRMVEGESLDAVVMPGSFNPLHEGHRRLAQVASEMLGGREVVFELAVVNVDKPPLEESEVRRRLRQFEGGWRVVLTRASRFYEKASLLPGCTFVIGWDTAIRLVDTGYYGDDEGTMLSALSSIRTAGCRFLVAGRMQGGVFRTLADVAVPPGFDDLFEAIPESRFRADVSSTELRSTK